MGYFRLESMMALLCSRLTCIRNRRSLTPKLQTKREHVIVRKDVLTYFT